jgi:hypothetical protein
MNHKVMKTITPLVAAIVIFAVAYTLAQHY